jgi:putative toxin-antitoxin system antitoxin component (TIGR02293 family)
MSESVAEVLGLKEAMTPMALVEQIERGLPLSSFNRVTQYVAPDDRKFRFNIIPKATWTRRQKSNRLSPGESEVIARIAAVWEKTVGLYKDEDVARRFLNQPHQLLEGRTPLGVALATSAGASLVDDILGRLEYGSAL